MQQAAIAYSVEHIAAAEASVTYSAGLWSFIKIKPFDLFTRCTDGRPEKTDPISRLQRTHSGSEPLPVTFRSERRQFDWSNMRKIQSGLKKNR